LTPKAPETGLMVDGGINHQRQESTSETYKNSIAIDVSKYTQPFFQHKIIVVKYLSRFEWKYIFYYNFQLTSNANS
jgi:hypothetical protein